MKLKVGQKVKVKCLDKMSVSEMRVTIGKTGIILNICDDEVVVDFPLLKDSWTFYSSSLKPAKLKLG